MCWLWRWWALSSESSLPHSLPVLAGVTLVSPNLAFLMFQRAPGTGEDSAPSNLDASDDLDVLRTRHARHFRKQRVL